MGVSDLYGLSIGAWLSDADGPRRSSLHLQVLGQCFLILSLIIVLVLLISNGERVFLLLLLSLSLPVHNCWKEKRKKVVECREV